LTIAFTLLAASYVEAGERDPDHHGPSTASEADHTFERAGYPKNVSHLAVPSLDPHAGPGYIGGSKLFGGDSRGPCDGTFGFDYQLFGWHPGRVFLSWAHDRSHQPQMGSYKTDTYHVPDPLTLTPVRRVLDEKKEK
jgi:hypothetical protein